MSNRFHGPGPAGGLVIGCLLFVLMWMAAGCPKAKSDTIPCDVFMVVDTVQSGFVTVKYDTTEREIVTRQFFIDTAYIFVPRTDTTKACTVLTISTPARIDK